ncbi:MAG: alpha/beta hydrolase-fold protein [Bacteroidota bacterium]
MIYKHPHTAVGTGCFLLYVLLLLPGCTTPEDRTGLQFEVTLADEAFADIAALGLETPINGRLFVVISRDDESEPRRQVGVSGVPFWGVDVENLTAGDKVIVKPGANGFRGFPLDDFAKLPADTYNVQALLSVYTTFSRADGHTVSLHLNSGAGQNQWRAPGNAHSTVAQHALDPAKRSTVQLTVDAVIQPERPLAAGEVLQQGNPEESEHVKFVKIKSEKLSAFWGHPMYIGANVLLPADYNSIPNKQYPVLYMQGHFPGGRAPFSFVKGSAGRGRSAGFADYWMSDAAPDLIVVSIRDANPYYDTSYSVNSANLGPYGDAIMEELIPALESRFRMIPDGDARLLAGGSTGGWEALAMQIYYPDDFGGAWGWCPDAVDFNYHQIVNIYEDDNAYYTDSEWHRVERPNARSFDGNIRSTVRQENHMELATGSNSRSGGQWAVWEAVYGPVGDNGYPRPIWDAETGKIDKETAQYWKENYDLHEQLRSRWETLGPKLTGKLHIATGDMDSYYLDNAVYLMEEFLNEASNPRAQARVTYGRRKPHCWIGESPVRPGENLNYIEFVQDVEDYLRRR